MKKKKQEFTLFSGEAEFEGDEIVNSIMGVQHTFNLKDIEKAIEKFGSKKKWIENEKKSYTATLEIAYEAFMSKHKRKKKK